VIFFDLQNDVFCFGEFSGEMAGKLRNLRVRFPCLVTNKQLAQISPNLRHIFVFFVWKIWAFNKDIQFLIKKDKNMPQIRAYF
jgi:hypothetical protein